MSDKTVEQLDTTMFLLKVGDIQQRLKAPKSERNTFANFNYRTLDGIEEALKPLLREHELLLTLSDDIIAVGDRVFLQATALLTDGTSSITAYGWGQHALDKKGMDDAQLTGATSTYARKYALAGMFLIDDSDDDPDSKDNSTPAKKITSPIKKETHDAIHASADNPASDKQIGLIRTLGKQKGVDTAKIEARIKTIHNSEDASTAINNLMAMKANDHDDNQ